jgi:hypothetical protein
MSFKLHFTNEAKSQLEALETDEKKQRKVRKCLGLIETNPKHPGLNSHKYSSLKSQDDRDVWESYVENNTPSAWRVFWFYGPETGEITILAIVEHP